MNGLLKLAGVTILARARGAGAAIGRSATSGKTFVQNRVSKTGKAFTQTRKSKGKKGPPSAADIAHRDRVQKAIADAHQIRKATKVAKVVAGVGAVGGLRYATGPWGYEHTITNSDGTVKSRMKFGF